MILCLPLLGFLASFQVRNLNISIPGVPISSAMDINNSDLFSLLTAAETHTGESISIWGDTAIGYIRALFQCQSSGCELEHVIVEIDVVSRFDLLLSNPALVRIEYGFDLRNNQVFASNVARDQYVLPPNFYEQFVNAQQLATNFGEVFDTALGISEDNFAQSNSQYTLSITWADCGQVRSNTWCLDFLTTSEGIQYEFNLAKRTFNQVFQ